MKPLFKTSAKDWRVLVRIVDVIIVAVVLSNVGFMAWDYAQTETVEFRWSDLSSLTVLLLLRVIGQQEREKKSRDEIQVSVHTDSAFDETKA
jgi:hypothetical protein